MDMVTHNSESSVAFSDNAAVNVEHADNIYALEISTLIHIQQMTEANATGQHLELVVSSMQYELFEAIYSRATKSPFVNVTIERVNE